MIPRIHFSGPARYQFQSIMGFCLSVLEACVRRLWKGPRRPGWNWFVELATQVLKQRMIAVFEAGGVNESRRYLDAIQINFPETAGVTITPATNEKVRGSWFTASNVASSVTVLYFHGGGYSFYPKAYSTFIALVTLAARSRTFALDYSLAPEYRFPTQIEEGVRAYRWLLESGVDPNSLVLAGDSAGGNLTLAVLLAARDAKLPLPALAVALSPPTDFETEYSSIERNRDSDWIERKMLVRWADWYCDPDQRRNPRVSPLWADLRDLPPIYIQAGSGEILYDSIRRFVDRAQGERIDVALETWEDMNHDFQILGRYTPQSAAALRRIGEVIGDKVRQRPKVISI